MGIDTQIPMGIIVSIGPTHGAQRKERAVSQYETNQFDHAEAARAVSCGQMDRPAYPRPTTVLPEIADLMVAAAARKAVWVNPEGTPFWLNSYEQAKAIAAKQGGVAFPPEARAQ